jgi:hypothetical protein
MRVLLILLLLTSPVLAAKRAWIAEFASGRIEAAAPIAQLPALRKNPAIDLSDGLPHSLVLSNNTRYFRIMCEVQCAFSSTGTASVDDIVLPVLKPEVFGIVGSSRTLSIIISP